MRVWKTVTALGGHCATRTLKFPLMILHHAKASKGRSVLTRRAIATFSTYACQSEQASGILSIDEAHVAIRHRLRGLLLAVHPDAMPGSSAEEKASNGESLARLNAILDAAEAEVMAFPWICLPLRRKAIRRPNPNPKISFEGARARRPRERRAQLGLSQAGFECLGRAVDQDPCSTGEHGGVEALRFAVARAALSRCPSRDPRGSRGMAGSAL